MPQIQTRLITHQNEPDLDVALGSETETDSKIIQAFKIFKPLQLNINISLTLSHLVLAYTGSTINLSLLFFFNLLLFI